MKAIAINDIPLFEENDNFRIQIDMEYEFTIKDKRVEIKQSEDGQFVIEIELERFNMIFIEKNGFLRQKRQSKLERIMND